MSQNRIIGRVLSVDNYRVFIKIEEDLKGAFKSGLNDIYEVARINSYLIIPVGADRIVALITRVTMKEEAELKSTTTSIVLPSSARYISATMVGTITTKSGQDSFVQGVYNFPSLDNPVWYVTKDDLDQIFDNKENVNEIDYQKDFYLPIGTSPAFQEYQVKICPDKFFVKHAAILGNTGSGKSCTLTSILRNLFKFNYKNDQCLSNAHIIIFDTNGEYKDAFMSDEAVDELEKINAYYYGGENNVKVPYWLMNWSDFRFLLKPGEGVQAPVLNRALGLAKNESEINEKNGVSTIYIQYLSNIESIIRGSSENYWKIKNYSKAIADLKSKNFILETGERLNDILNKIPNGEGYIKPEPSLMEEISISLKAFIRGMEEKNRGIQITNEQNIDLPKWFSYQKLCKRFLDASISQEENSNNKIAEYMSTLRLRMNSFLNDKRIAIPLMLKDTGNINKDILPQFLSLIIGDFNKIFNQSVTKKKETERNSDTPDIDKENFIDQYNKSTQVFDSNRTNQITIIDMSQLPYEVLETVTGLLGRIILEFVANFVPEQRGKYPIVLVLEEAQNYIAEEKDSIAKTVFERIAREGRKYGISLIVSSQRPSELSKTVLSQCNSFIIHRLQNPDDQKYVRGLISSANADLLDQLPIIPQQHAIITGDCVRTPVLVRMDDVSPTPNSHNPVFVENWLNEKDNETVRDLYEQTCNRWLGKNETEGRKDNSPETTDGIGDRTDNPKEFPDESEAEEP